MIVHFIVAVAVFLSENVCSAGKNPKVGGTDVLYLASLFSASLKSDHTLVPVNITDSGQSIFSYAAEEKQVK